LRRQHCMSIEALQGLGERSSFQRLPLVMKERGRRADPAKVLMSFNREFDDIFMGHVGKIQMTRHFVFRAVTAFPGVGRSRLGAFTAPLAQLAVA
jgi:hypothetical protein